MPRRERKAERGNLGRGNLDATCGDELRSGISKFLLDQHLLASLHGCQCEEREKHNSKPHCEWV